MSQNERQGSEENSVGETGKCEGGFLCGFFNKHSVFVCFVVVCFVLLLLFLFFLIWGGGRAETVLLLSIFLKRNTVYVLSIWFSVYYFDLFWNNTFTAAVTCTAAKTQNIMDKLLWQEKHPIGLLM